MTDIGTEVKSVEIKTNGSYVGAVFNPKPDQFNKELSQASHTILEIGCGAKDPRISWQPAQGDIWIGCDPGINPGESSTISVHKGSLPIHSQSKLVVFSDEVADIPTFKPDIILAVAPNQKDIAEGKIFNDGMEKFLDSKFGKQQLILICMDTRTREYLEFQREATNKIFQWTKENRFENIKSDDPNLDDILDEFKPNSADLGANVLRMYFIRNPKK